MPVGADELDLFDDPYHPHGGCLSFYESLIVHSVAALLSAGQTDQKVISQFSVDQADMVVAELKARKAAVDKIAQSIEELKEIK